MKLIVSIFALFLVQVAFTQEAPAKKEETKKSCCVSKSVKSEDGKAVAGGKKECSTEQKKACEAKKAVHAENVKAAAGEKKDCCKSKKACDPKKES